MSESVRQETIMDTNIALLLGEIRGQLKELIHTNNNMAMEVKALAIRVSALEAVEQHRAGASNLAKMFMNSPVVGWLAAAGVALYALLERSAT